MSQNEEDFGEDGVDVIEEKIADLRSVKDATQAQKDELATLQADRKTRLQRRTTALLGRAKAAEEKARQAEERVKNLEDKFTVAERRLPAEKTTRAKVTFDGEDFFTDASLRSMVSAGEMTEDDAWSHQEERRVAAAADRMSKKSEKNSFEKTRQETIASVLGEYPQLNPQNAKYNKEDPLTKEVDRLLRNGYQYKPDGLKIAVEDARRFLRITDKKPDLSDEFGVTRSEFGNEESIQRGEKKIILSDWESDNAIRMWVNTGMINPKTNKPYTKPEALEKALNAKKNRASEMAAR